MGNPPTTSDGFDRAYRAPITFWGDIRIPPEIKTLARTGRPQASLELGCGVGRLTRYMAEQGLDATGVDFSPVAIAKAQARVARDKLRPRFLVGDVTHLEELDGPFDISFDVGCFHCLDAQGRAAYATELHRLLKSQGTHLIWALDHAPSSFSFSPTALQSIFANGFRLQDARMSRRRLVRSHWYWLVRV